MLTKFLSRNKFIIFASVLCIFFLFPTSTYAAHPRLISMIIGAFDSIKVWIIRIATPATAVAVRHRSIHAKI